MTGQVDFLNRALLTVTFRGPHRHETVDAVIDTGFNGFVSLSRGLAVRLGLKPQGLTTAQHADGRIHTMDTFIVEVNWFGRPQKCVAVDSDLPTCLLGTALLDGRVLEVDFGPAKSVQVR